MEKSRRAVDLVVRGEGVQAAHAVLTQVLIELAADLGGQLRFSMSDPIMVEQLAQQLRQKGIDPSIHRPGNGSVKQRVSVPLPTC